MFEQALITSLDGLASLIVVGAPFDFSDISLAIVISECFGFPRFGGIFQCRRFPVSVGGFAGWISSGSISD